MWGLHTANNWLFPMGQLIFMLDRWWYVWFQIFLSEYWQLYLKLQDRRRGTFPKKILVTHSLTLTGCIRILTYTCVNKIHCNAREPIEYWNNTYQLKIPKFEWQYITAWLYVFSICLLWKINRDTDITYLLVCMFYYDCEHNS